MNVITIEQLTCADTCNRICAELQSHFAGTVGWRKDEIRTMGGSTVRTIYFFEEVKKWLLFVLPITTYRTLACLETTLPLIGESGRIYWYFNSTISRAIPEEIIRGSI